MFHKTESIQQVANRLHLDKGLVHAMTKKLGYSNPTVCQEQAWTAAQSGKSVFLMSATGSGKTVSFLVPLVQKVLTSKLLLKTLPKVFTKAGMDHDNCPFGIILVPSKELAAQIHSVLATDLLSPSPHHTDLPTVSDVSTWHSWFVSEQARLSKKKGKTQKASGSMQSLVAPANILIGTPLAVRDWSEATSKTLNGLITADQLLATVRMLVVDEADAIFDKTDDAKLNARTEKAITSICSWVGGGSSTSPVQGFVASATLGAGVEKLRGMITHNVVELRVDSRIEDEEDKVTDAFSNRDQVEETFLLIPKGNKEEKEEERYLMLYGLLKKRVLFTPAIVFTNSTMACIKTACLLRQFGFRTSALIEDMTNEGRHEIIEQFSKGFSDILVFCDKGISDNDDEDSDIEETDEKASGHALSVRGIDFGGRVASCINFDLPHDYETYVHRIGRCGRGGEEGVSLSFIEAPQPNQVSTVPDWFSEEVETENISHLDPEANLKAQCAQFRYRVRDVMRSLSRQIVVKAKIDEVKASMKLTDRLSNMKFEDSPKGRRDMREYLKEFASGGGDMATQVPEGVPVIKDGEIRMYKAKSIRHKIDSGKWQEKFESGSGHMKKKFNANFKKKGTFAATMRKTGQNKSKKKKGTRD